MNGAPMANGALAGIEIETGAAIAIEGAGVIEVAIAIEATILGGNGAPSDKIKI